MIVSRGNEGNTHLKLKRKAIQLINIRSDVQYISTERPILKSAGARYSYVDVFAIKDDGSHIYVEVKTKSNMPEAITQLMAIHSTNPADEFIIICNFKSTQFFKTLLRENQREWQAFINKTKVYNFDNVYNLKRRLITFTQERELWIDNIRIM